MTSAQISITIAQIQNTTAGYQNFINSYGAAADTLRNVIETGTPLYNDPVMAELFPNSWSAYQQYLLNLQTAINTFVASLPTAPPLSG